MLRGLDPDWRTRAACRGGDPELFDVDRRRKDWQERVQVAKAICSRCPVDHLCLAEGVAVGDQDLIRAGLEADERKDMHLAGVS